MSEWSAMNDPTHDELVDEFHEVISDGLPRISRGDEYLVDEYVLLLQKMGFDADYENIYDDHGFIAQVTIDGKNHALWQGGITNVEQSVLTVQHPVEDFERS